MLDKRGRRLYGMAYRRIEMGGPEAGFNIKSLYAVHLTTREGDDNSKDRFIKDFKKLMLSYIRKLYPKTEYCFLMAYTPEKGLLHAHGLIRIKGGFLKLYEGKVKDNKEQWKDNDGHVHSEHIDANRRALGDKWNEIHHAFAVYLERLWSMDGYKKYMVSHMLKDYTNEGMIESNFLVSRGWKHELPEGFEKDFKGWYKTACGVSWLGAEGWKLYNRVVMCVCAKKNVLVILDGGQLAVLNGKVHYQIKLEDGSWMDY